MSLLIYIHGFNSSPRSYKAQRLVDYIQQHQCVVDYQLPELSDQPDRAIAQLTALVEQAGQDVVLIGSSLGGYYATWLACQYGLRAVLINPAVRPYELLREYLGPNKNFHSGEEYVLTENHIEALRQLETQPGPCYELLDVYLESGDEVLDYRQAEAKYQRARLHLFPGGDHSFINFEMQISDILKKLGVSCQASMR